MGECGRKIYESGVYELASGEFYGEYQHSMDDKGRVIVPAKHREGLGNQFMLTKGHDNCLYIYPLESWSVFRDKLLSLPDADKQIRHAKRFFMSAATPCELDKQGRILIPQNLREHALLTKELYFIGNLDKVEIWDKDRWLSYNGDNDSEYMEQCLAALGI